MKNQLPAELLKTNNKKGQPLAALLCI